MYYVKEGWKARGGNYLEGVLGETLTLTFHQRNIGWIAGFVEPRSLKRNADRPARKTINLNYWPSIERE